MSHSSLRFPPLATLFFLAALISAASALPREGVGGPTAVATPPNLIVILTDDLGYADVGFNGCRDIPTPNIDRIAYEGVTCTNAYVTYAVCGPSRAGLITGRYQDRFGFSRNPLFAPRDSTMGLPQSEETLAEVLGRAGYRSAALGKWHLGAHESQRPLDRGFEHFFGFLSGGHRYLPAEWDLPDEWSVTSQYEAYRTKLLRDRERVEENEYLTDALSREAVRYVREFKDDPFFLYLAYNAPHAPLQATETYLQRFAHLSDPKRRTYAAMVSAVDDGVGHLLDALDELGIADNTLVVFLSDNGGQEVENHADNGPLRGQKGDFTEGGIRVPFAVRWPRRITPGTTYPEPVSSMDIFASIVAANPGLVPDNPLDGVDLLPYLTGRVAGAPHAALFWKNADQEKFAVRSATNKFLHRDGSDHRYDLETDIGEQQNLHRPGDTTSAALRARYLRWSGQMQEPAFLGLGEDKAYSASHPDRYRRPAR